MEIMELTKRINMVGNFKILLLFLCLISCVKTDNKEKIAEDLVNQNIQIMLDSVSYFDLSKMNVISNENKKEKLEVSIIDNVMIHEFNEATLYKFNKKFKIKENNIKPIFLKIKKLPINNIDGYPIKLISKISQSNANSVNIELANLLLDESNEFSCITVIKSRGIGTRIEIYYFEHRNNKWVFVGKELLALG